MLTCFLQLPEFNVENYFTTEIVSFVIICLILISCILTCILGYKHFQSSVVFILGLIGSYYCMILLDTVTYPVVKAFLFATFTMLIMCLVYGVTIILQSLLAFMKIRKPLVRGLPVVTAFAGALGTVFIVYTRFFRNLPFAIVIFLLLTIGGAYHQIQTRKVTPDFHTYGDLIKLKPQSKEDVTE